MMELYLVGKVSLKLWNMTSRNIISNILKYNITWKMKVQKWPNSPG